MMIFHSFFGIRRSELNYIIPSLLSFLFAGAVCIIRFSFTVSDEFWTVGSAWFHLALFILVGVVFSSVLIAKTLKSRRFHSILTSLFAFIVSAVFVVVDTTDDLIYNNFEGIGWGTLLLSAGCGICFAVVVCRAALEDKQTESHNDDHPTESDVREKESVALATDAVDRLFQLKQLLDAGILSEKEYEEKKTQYVNKL